MFKWLSRKFETCKHRIYAKLLIELRQFIRENAENETLDRRIFSLYYFLSCHSSYDDMVVSLNRFIETAKETKAYSFKEVLLFRTLLLRLELPMLWLNRLIKIK